MIFRLLVIVHLLSANIRVFASDSTTILVVRASQNRMDVFVGLEYSRPISQYLVCGSVEVGINRTFIQQRFFPRVLFGISRDILTSSPHFLGPELNLGGSALKVNALTSHLNFYSQYLAGVKYMSKGKLKFVSGVSFGWMTEYLYSQIDDRYRGFGTWAYEVKIGLGYAL